MYINSFKPHINPWRQVPLLSHSADEKPQLIAGFTCCPRSHRSLSGRAKNKTQAGLLQSPCTYTVSSRSHDTLQKLKLYTALGIETRENKTMNRRPNRESRVTRMRMEGGREVRPNSQKCKLNARS